MKLNKFSSLFESSNTPVIAVLESAEILGEDNALVEATLIQADGKFYGIKQDGSIHEAMRKSNRHFKLFAESLQEAPQWLVSESEKYITETSYTEGDKVKFMWEGKWLEGEIESPEEDGEVLIDGVRVPIKDVKKIQEGDEAEFQAYKDKMMKKHGFTDWEEASKDKDFMNALDRGWNAEDEKGKDGLNEGFSYKQSIQIQNILDQLPIDIGEELGDHLDKGDVSGFTKKLDKLISDTKRDWDKGLHYLLRDVRRR